VGHVRLPDVVVAADRAMLEQEENDFIVSELEPVVQLAYQDENSL